MGEVDEAAPASGNAEVAFIEALQDLQITIRETGAKVDHDPLPSVKADHTALSQLFQNLISNAIKYRKNDISPEIQISAARDDDKWIFSVTDNGIGIAPEHFEQIFVPFKRLHGADVAGAGIGLATCKRIVERYGGPERLVLRERTDPVPGEDEVLVRTAAIGLNFADLFVRSGDYPRTPKPPFVPGMEISGTIEAIGPKVAGLVAGQSVVGLPIFGGHAEKVSVPAARVFPLPEGADPVDAAAVAVTFLTAWYACHRAQVAPGDRVVVTAAAGGVGTALLQLLRERGAAAVALVGSEAKLPLCRELGAAAVGLYGRRRFAR